MVTEYREASHWSLEAGELREARHFILGARVHVVATQQDEVRAQGVDAIHEPTHLCLREERAFVDVADKSYAHTIERRRDIGALTGVLHRLDTKGIKQATRGRPKSGGHHRDSRE
jgi:hypothetical protein